MGLGFRTVPLLLAVASLLAACTRPFSYSPKTFALSLSPTSVSLTQGGRATPTLTLTPENGFTGTVALSLAGAPQGVSLSPQSVQVSGPDPVNAPLTLTASPSTPAGIYGARLRAASGSFAREVALTLRVVEPSYALALSPASPRASQGGSAQVQVRLERQDFAGPVALFLEGSELLSTSPVPDRIAWSLSPNPAGGDGATLTLQVGSKVPTGSYALTVRGKAEGLADRTASLNLTVTPTPSFALSDPNPGSLTLPQGGTGAFQVTLTPENGFQGPVFLSLVDGKGSAVPGIVLQSTNPSPVQLSGSPLQVAATVRVETGVPSGTYGLRVRAQGENVVREKPLSLLVTPPPSFTLSLSPTSLTIQQGASARILLTLTPQSGFQGTVSLSLVGAPGGVRLSPTTVQVSGSASISQTLTLQVDPSVNTGSYALEVVGTSGSLAERASLNLTVTPPPSFAFALNPPSLTVQQGGGAPTTLTVTPQNGFTGTVALSLAGAPQGVSLSPQSVQVPGTPVTQALTVSVDPGVAPGSYQVKVRGTSGNLTREADLALTVVAPSGDFSLTLESPSLSLTPGGTGYVRLSVAGSYAGPIALSLVDESGNPFRGVSLSPTSTPVPSAPMLELTASPSLAQGTYSLKVRGSGGGLVREAPLTLQVSAVSPQNLRLVKAAWGQTVLKENLRLVAGKPALLRVHLVATPNPIPLAQALSGAVYLGNAFQGNLSFTCPNPIPLATEEGNLATTCNATLPEAWVAPGLRVELRADPNNQVVETDESDNALTLNPSVGPGTALFLTVVPVVHQGQTASVPGFSQTLWRVWPLKETPYTTRAPYTFSGTLSGQDANAWSQLLDELRVLRQVDGSGRYYYGFVKVGYTSGIAGIGYIGYPVAAGWDYSQSAPAVMAHELGHNFGREHTPCGTSGDPNYPYADGKIGTWGYDLASGALKDPGLYHDLMSYCAPLWVSDYSYEGAQSFLENNPPRPQSLPEEGLLFSGRIRGDEVVFNPPLWLRAAPEGRASPYRLEVDGLSLPVYLLEDSEGTLHFQALAPVAPFRRIALLRDGALLKERVQGPRPQAEPLVELREEGLSLVVRWQGDPFLSVFHVAGDGTRTALGLWHTGGEARLALQNLPPGGAFEVQLSDGLGVRRQLFPR